MSGTPQTRNEMMQGRHPEKSAGSVSTADVEFCRFVVRSLPIAVAVVDRNLKILRFNPSAEKITGYAEEETIGRQCAEVLRGGMCGVDCPMKTVISLRQSTVQIETTIQTRDDQIIPVKMNTAGLFDKDGHLIGGIEAFQDISALKALEREKANLASMFAHDMNSSLTGIHGLALRLSKTDDLNTVMPRKFIEVIEKEAAKLEGLVRDFLEFSRLQAGQLHLNFTATSLDKELWELFDLYQPKASQRGITLELHTAGALPIIEADIDRLHRVFTNLLDNALKFSKEKGKITIRVEEADQEVKVQIKDEGIGIGPDDLPYIFDLFYRGRSVATKKGSGVGLGTVKAIVEGHRGRVFVASELGKGTVFTVLLPKVRQLDEE